MNTSAVTVINPRCRASEGNVVGSVALIPNQEKGGGGRQSCEKPSRAGARHPLGVGGLMAMGALRCQSRQADGCRRSCWKRG